MSTSKLSLTNSIAKKYGVEKEKLDLWLAVCPTDLPDADYAAFVYQCVRTNLDPLARQIYLVARKGRGAVQTGIDGYRLIADRTGKYAGSDDPVYDEGLTQYQFLQTGRKNPSTATVSVYKLVGDHVAKFTATAEWSAYYPGPSQGYMWHKMGLLMIAKVCEALALRKAFPAELSGIYTSEEMMQAGEADNDLATEEITKEAFNVVNKNAVHVIEKMEALGIDESDPIVISVLGCHPREVAATQDGNNKLRALWNLLKRKESSGVWEVD